MFLSGYFPINCRLIFPCPCVWTEMGNPGYLNVGSHPRTFGEGVGDILSMQIDPDGVFGELGRRGPPSR